VSVLKERSKGVYVVLDPSLDDAGLTFLDLYYDEDERMPFIDGISRVISNLTSLGVDGFVVGDEWPRGVNRREIGIDHLSAYNETYFADTGFWIRGDLDDVGKTRLADWFYERSLDAWNSIGRALDSRFPHVLLGTNLDLSLNPDLSSGEIPLWTSVDLWDMIDLEPYDFVVTHCFTKQRWHDYQGDTIGVNSTSSGSTSALESSLQSLLESGRCGGTRIYLLLAAHCSYPHVITPGQMVDEWNTVAGYEIGGVGWFAFDLWPSGNLTGNWWIESTSIAEAIDVPMRYERLLTLTGILEAHNYLSGLREVDRSETQSIEVMEEQIRKDLAYLSSLGYERRVRYPLPVGLGGEIEGMESACNVTHDANLQVNPGVSGRRVVWEDGRNGNRDIYVYDLDSSEEIRITLGGDQEQPSIGGRYVVYWDLFFAPRYIWVEDLVNRIWNLTGTTSIDRGSEPRHRGGNESRVYSRGYIRGLGHDMATLVCIDPGNGSRHSLYLTVSYTGEWTLETDQPIGRGYSALVSVEIMPSGTTTINLKPGVSGNPEDSSPFRLTFNPRHLNWPSMVPEDYVNRSTESYWKSSRGLCVYDLASNSVRVLDLVPMGDVEVFIDDAGTWVGYQTGRNELVFLSVSDDRKTVVTRWGASVDLDCMYQGGAFWTQRVQHHSSAYRMDLESTVVCVVEEPHTPGSDLSPVVFEDNGDIIVQHIGEIPLCIGLLLLILLAVLEACDCKCL
jgi:beta propeller repeat protein